MCAQIAGSASKLASNARCLLPIVTMTCNFTPMTAVELSAAHLLIVSLNPPYQREAGSPALAADADPCRVTGADAVAAVAQLLPSITPLTVVLQS